MPFIKPIAYSVIACFAVASIAYAADPPADKNAPKAAKAAAKPAAAKVEPADGPRYPKQFNRIASLSDDQKKKLLAISEKAVAEKIAIDARAKQDYLAVLTNEQRTELLAIEQTGAGKKANRKPDAAKPDAPKAKPDAKPPAAKPDKK